MLAACRVPKFKPLRDFLQHKLCCDHVAYAESRPLACSSFLGVLESLIKTGMYQKDPAMSEDDSNQLSQIASSLFQMIEARRARRRKSDTLGTIHGHKHNLRIKCVQLLQLILKTCWIDRVDKFFHIWEQTLAERFGCRGSNGIPSSGEFDSNFLGQSPPQDGYHGRNQIHPSTNTHRLPLDVDEWSQYEWSTTLLNQLTSALFESHPLLPELAAKSLSGVAKRLDGLPLPSIIHSLLELLVHEQTDLKEEVFKLLCAIFSQDELLISQIKGAHLICSQRSFEHLQIIEEDAERLSKTIFGLQDHGFDNCELEASPEALEILSRWEYILKCNSSNRDIFVDLQTSLINTGSIKLLVTLLHLDTEVSKSRRSMLQAVYRILSYLCESRVDIQKYLLHQHKTVIFDHLYTGSSGAETLLLTLVREDIDLLAQTGTSIIRKYFKSILSNSLPISVQQLRFLSQMICSRDKVFVDLQLLVTSLIQDHTYLISSFLVLSTEDEQRRKDAMENSREVVDSDHD